MRLTLLFCIILFTQAGTAQTNDKRIVALEPQLQKLLSDWKAAGFAVAVVKNNKVIYSKGFGYRDYEKKLPVTTNTLFPIGSCTKAFTAATIGLLDKEKKVELDKPVANYLPSLKFFNDALTDKVSLRDMMSHRTGLPRHDFSWYLFASTSRDSLLKRIAFMEPTAGLREKWQYNNFMYLLQGVVIEKVTNKTWEENIREKILQPLNMNRSNFTVSALQHDADAALGYGLKKDSIIKKLDYYNIDAMGPAGSINSSVQEMSNWLITWINNGKFQGKELLPLPYIKQAISSQFVVSPALPDSAVQDVFFSNYGLGWFLSAYRGHYRVEHGGNIDGFSANTSFFPTDSLGIVVLSNQNASAIPSLVRNIIADKLLQLNPVDWNSLRKTAVNKAKAAAEAGKPYSQRKDGTKPSHPLKDFEGIYSNPGYGSMEVAVKNDSLYALFPGKEVWLRHYHYNVFEPFEKHPVEGIDTSENALKMQFMMDINGNIHAINAAFEPTLDPLVFTRKPKEVEVSASALKKYEGTYELAGVDVKIYTKNGALHAFVPGQPEYELAATGEHKFSIKILNGYSLEFHPDSSGVITSVSFIQPNGTFTATKK